MASDAELTVLRREVVALRTEVEGLRTQTVVSAQATQRLSEGLEVVNDVQIRQAEVARGVAEAIRRANEIADEQARTAQNVVPRSEHERRWRREDQEFLDMATYRRRHRRLVAAVYVLLVAVAVGGWVLFSQASDAATDARNAVAAQKRAAYNLCAARNGEQDTARATLPRLAATAPDPTTAAVYRAFLPLIPRDVDCRPLLR